MTEEPLYPAILAIQLYLLLVAIDVLLAWVQPDPARWPRRATHALTEPPQAALRRLVPPARTGGWDVTPLLVVLALGVIRVILVVGW